MNWVVLNTDKDERHDITKVLELARMFEEKYGPEAASEYVQHLADDINGKLGHRVEDVQAMFGLYYLIRDFFVAAAALVGALIWQKSPQFCQIAAFLFGTAGTLGIRVFRHRPFF